MDLWLANCPMHWLVIFSISDRLHNSKIFSLKPQESKLCSRSNWRHLIPERLAYFSFVLSLFLGVFILTSVWIVYYTSKHKKSLLITVRYSIRAKAMGCSRQEESHRCRRQLLICPASIFCNYFWRPFYELSATGLCAFLRMYWDWLRRPVAGDFLKYNYRIWWNLHLDCNKNMESC